MRYLKLKYNIFVIYLINHLIMSVSNLAVTISSVQILAVALQKIKNLDNFGKIEPFVSFQHNQKQFQTSVKDFTQGAPILFNETYYLSNVGEDETLDFELYDKDPIGQEMLGKAKPILVKDLIKMTNA